MTDETINTAERLTDLPDEDHELRGRVERVRKAFLDEGAYPPYHRRQVERLRQEWPTLYYAILNLI